MRKAGPILLVSALIFLSLFSMLSLSSEADPIAEVAVETPPMMCEVDVSPGSPANATVKGNVTCTNYDTSTPLIVNLTANYPIGNSSLNKTQIIFQGSHYEEEIEISIQLPTLTSAHEIHACSVSGYWEQGTTNGTVIRSELLVVPLNFYRFTIFSETPFKEVTQGESTDFLVIINNTGNCNDEYLVNITNREELESFNLPIFNLHSIPVAQGDARTQRLIMHTSSDTPVGDYKIHVNVTSVGSGSEEDEIIYEEYTLTVAVKGESKVDDDVIGVILIVSLILLFVVILIIIAIVVFRKRTRTKEGYP